MWANFGPNISLSKYHSNPYKTETFTKENKLYEVFLYYTKRYGYPEKYKFTPVIFYEGKVVGWGWMHIDDDVEKLKVDFNNK